MVAPLKKNFFFKLSMSLTSQEQQFLSTQELFSGCLTTGEVEGANPGTVVFQLREKNKKTHVNTRVCGAADCTNDTNQIQYHILFITLHRLRVDAPCNATRYRYVALTVLAFRLHFSA